MMENGLKDKTRLVYGIVLAVIVVAAAFLRLYQLEMLPRGPYYDEAANGILAGEIARGRAFPIFIRAYTGKEVLYFYLVAAVMKVLGVNLLSLRLTSALMGVLTVAVTYWLGLELFAGREKAVRQRIALAAAALMAVNFWHIAISRYGFRAISQPLLQGATLLFMWRGLRRGGWKNVILGGVFCGLTAYTYLSSRIVPLALLSWVVGLWIACRGKRRIVAGRILVFGLAAAVVGAPLGVFFLRNPETFGTRMGQVSVFNPELNEGDLWGTLWQSIKAAFGMFTVRGDPQWRFGVVGRPVFDRFVGLFVYVGVLVSLYRVVCGPRATQRVLHLSMLLWVPLLLIPSILGVREVPHSLRAIGVMPILFYFPALGFSAALDGLARLFKQPKWLPLTATTVVLAGLLLVEGGLSTGYAYFGVWGTHPQPYYENDNDLADAARALNEMDLGEAEIWVASEHYRHPTMAFLARDYARIHWLVGEDVIALPPADDGPGAVYLFPRSAMPHPSLLAQLDAVATAERHLGPDGGTAFLIYRLPAGTLPALTPQYEQQVNFGNQIELLGYDLAPTMAGKPLTAVLYWRVLAPPKADDYLLFAHLRDAWGLHWGTMDAFDYPSAEWAPGQIILQRRGVPVPAEAPPGMYELVVGFSSRGQNARLPRLDAQGRVAGTTVLLGPAEVAQADMPAADPPSVQRPLQVSFGDFHLLGFKLDQGTVRQGDRLYLGLLWQAAGALPDLDLALQLGSLTLWEGRPVHGTYSTDRWPVGIPLFDRYGLVVPSDAPPGDQPLTLTVRDRESGAVVGEPVQLATVRVQEVDRRMIVPPIEHPMSVNLGGQVEFLGYDLDRTEVAPGETLSMTLYWRALSEMEMSYTVFNHLLDGDSRIRGQQDNLPVHGTYPTTLWVPGEVVVDEYAFAVHADALPGEHAIEVGMYVAETMQRLPVLDEAGQISGDRILAGVVQVVE